MHGLKSIALSIAGLAHALYYNIMLNFTITVAPTFNPIFKGKLLSMFIEENRFSTVPLRGFPMIMGIYRHLGNN